MTVPEGWSDPLPEWVPDHWWIWATPADRLGRRRLYFRNVHDGRATVPAATIDQALDKLQLILLEDRKNGQGI